MTTKKDFIAAAKTIAAITDPKEKETVANNFCTIFQNQNQRFDKVKFLNASDKSCKGTFLLVVNPASVIRTWAVFFCSLILIVIGIL